MDIRNFFTYFGDDYCWFQIPVTCVSYEEIQSSEIYNTLIYDISLLLAFTCRAEG